jgi:hypothetical protein
MTAACAGGRGHGPRAQTEPAPGNGNDDQGDAEPGPVASSTSDATRRHAKHASVPPRRVRAGELRWEKFRYELKAGPAGASGRPPAGRRHDGHWGAGLTLHLGGTNPQRTSRTTSEAGRRRRAPVALAPRRLDVQLRAIPARRPLVIEPMLGTPTTTRTPQPPNRGLDRVPHHSTPPRLHRVSTGRIPMAPGLGLGPVTTSLALVIELMLAGRATTPPPQPRPHRLDPVHHDPPPMCCDGRARRAACQSPT